MLDAEQRRVVAGGPQRVQDVLLVIVEDEAAMRQSEHAVAVRAHAGEQAGAAGRAGRRGVEGLPEQDAFIGQSLQIRRRHGMSVGLQIAAGVVRMNIDDIGPARARLRERGGSRAGDRSEKMTARDG